jgi:hypothetical protein
MRFLLQPFKLRDAILTLEQMGVAAAGQGSEETGADRNGADDEAESDADSEAHTV